MDEPLAALSDRSLSKIKQILMDMFREQKCSIYLFGSRARGDAMETSDFDIAVFAENDIDKEMTFVREQFELSNIPHTVELIDLNKTSETFRNCVLEEGILLWEN